MIDLEQIIEKALADKIGTPPVPEGWSVLETWAMVRLCEAARNTNTDKLKAQVENLKLAAEADRRRIAHITRTRILLREYITTVHAEMTDLKIEVERLRELTVSGTSR